MLFVDECHLMSGDLEGYVWGRRNKKVKVPIINEREKQTYYGALDLLSKRVLIEAQERGNSACTLAYLKFLQLQFPDQRLLILWDGASYHRSEEVKSALDKLNSGLPESQWRIHCIRFAPNDPTQNPIEDVWLQAKTWVRNMAGLKPSFRGLKALFEQFCTLEIFDFPKMYMYGKFSPIK